MDSIIQNLGQFKPKIMVPVTVIDNPFFQFCAMQNLFTSSIRTGMRKNMISDSVNDRPFFSGFSLVSRKMIVPVTTLRFFYRFRFGFNRFSFLVRLFLKL